MTLRAVQQQGSRELRSMFTVSSKTGAFWCVSKSPNLDAGKCFKVFLSAGLLVMRPGAGLP